MTIEIANKRDRSGKLVLSLDELRASDVGVITSMGGATSAVLFSVQSGTNVYIQKLWVAPFSGSFGAFRVLDGATVKTLPFNVTVSQGTGLYTRVDNLVGAVEIPISPGRFVSGIVIENMSGNGGATANATTVSGILTAAFYAEVIVDPKVDEE